MVLGLATDQSSRRSTHRGGPQQARTSTRAEPLTAAGQNCCPPAGSYMAATGQDLMAADNATAERRRHATPPIAQATGPRRAPRRSSCVARARARRPRPNRHCAGVRSSTARSTGALGATPGRARTGTQAHRRTRGDRRRRPHGIAAAAHGDPRRPRHPCRSPPPSPGCVARTAPDRQMGHRRPLHRHRVVSPGRTRIGQRRVPSPQQDRLPRRGRNRRRRYLAPRGHRRQDRQRPPRHRKRPHPLRRPRR